jgi:hypothetical protein
MTFFSLDIPEYFAPSIRFIMEVMNGFYDLDPLLSGIQRESSIHRGPIRNIPGNNPLDQEIFKVESTASVSFNIISNSDIESYIYHLVELSESYCLSIKHHLLENLSQITDATGTSINENGKPFSYDMILDLLEKVEFEFDDLNNPRFPSLIIPHDYIEILNKTQPTQTQDERFKRIIEEKRAIFNAKKRTRRLPR